MKRLIVIAGPTASGKTALSIRLAKHFRTEIVSADSRQFFREMKVGTAKPSDTQLQEVKHHFINSLSVEEEYNAGMYESDALSVIENYFSKNEFLLMTGGSGLYINAVLFGFDNLPPTDQLTRKKITERYAVEGITFLQKEIRRLDPEYASGADLNNPQRLMRALEACYISGKPYSSLISKSARQRQFDFTIYVLDVPREELYMRINNRVDEMVEGGLFEEARALYSNKNLRALQTVGYKEIFESIENGVDIDITINKIKQNTRNYAKRQMTWFRGLQEAIIVPAEKAFDYIIEMEAEK